MIRAGFSLVEMLAVMLIMTILLTLGIGAMKSSGSRGKPAAIEISRSLSYARAYAVAQNLNAWVKFSIPEEKEEDLELRFYYSLDSSGTDDSMTQFRRRIVMENLRVSNQLEDFDNRPDTPAEARLDLEGTIVFTPSGEAYLGTSTSDRVPPPGPEIRRLVEIGIQPTLDGRVTDRLKSDLAALQIQGSPGTSIVYAK